MIAADIFASLLLIFRRFSCQFFAVLSLDFRGHIRLIDASFSLMLQLRR